MLNQEEILNQEQATAVIHFGNNDLNQFVDILQNVAQSNYENVAVLIKINNRPIFFHAGKNTTNENNVWIKKKENTVDTFDHSSLFEKALFENNPLDFYESNGLSPKDYALAGGGLPIIVQNSGIIGSLIISGLTDEEDHELGYRALLSYKLQIE